MLKRCFLGWLMVAMALGASSARGADSYTFRFNASIVYALIGVGLNIDTVTLGPNDKLPLYLTEDFSRGDEEEVFNPDFDLSKYGEMRGWYTKSNGKGTMIYNAKGVRVCDLSAYEVAAMCDKAKVLTKTYYNIYPYIDGNLATTGVFINGVEVNGRTADEDVRRTSGAGWTYSQTGKLVTLTNNAAQLTYTITGTNRESRVHFKVAATNVVIKAEGLVLESTNTQHQGLIMVPPGNMLQFNVELKKPSELKVKSVSGVSNYMAGIYCPTGAAVTVRGTLADRSVTWTDATNNTHTCSIVTTERNTKMLTVVGGVGSAAIGGVSGSCGGLSGAITLDGCSVWVDSGNGNIPDIGPGTIGSGVDKTLCETIYFLNHPNVRNATQTSETLPEVYPQPHDEYEQPLFALPISDGEDKNSRDVWNVYWVPYGKVYSKQYKQWFTGYSIDWRVETVTSEITHTNR